MDDVGVVFVNVGVYVFVGVLDAGVSNFRSRFRGEIEIDEYVFDVICVCYWDGIFG